MKITKIGHCCLLIEEKGLRILTDPGTFSSGQNELQNIDLVLITHEHQDHFHIESVKLIMQNNPNAIIYTNSSVGKILLLESMKFEILEHAQIIDFKGVILEGHGQKHDTIYQDYGQVQNTGFMIGGKLFYPGDALYNPQKPIEVLAIPIIAPWLKASEAIEYALTIKPKKAFPVHDALLNPDVGAFWYHLFDNFLGKSDIVFIDTTRNKEFEV